MPHGEPSTSTITNQLLTLDLFGPGNDNIKTLALGEAGEPLVVRLPVLVGGVGHGHVEADAGAEDARHGAEQVHGRELHAQTQPGAAAPGHQVLVEGTALLLRVPPPRQKVVGLLKDLGVVVDVLAGCRDASLLVGQ